MKPESAAPLSIRTQGVAISAALEASIQQTLARRLGPFARHIESVTVRFEDINGPRGGIDTECRIKVVIPSRPGVVVHDRAASARLAFDAAARAMRSAVKHDLERMGFTEGRAKPKTAARGRKAADAVDASVEAAPQARKTKARATVPTSEVEDDVQAEPARPAPRKRANHIESALKLGRRARSLASSPQTRAAAAAAKQAGR